MTKRKKGKKRSRGGEISTTATQEELVGHTKTNAKSNSEIRIDIKERYPAADQPISHRKASISQFSSWNQAFQAAASVTPHDLGDDYVDPSCSPACTPSAGPMDHVHHGGGDILGISRIANEFLDRTKKNVGKMKEEEKANDTNIDSASPKKRKKQKKQKKDESKKAKKKEEKKQKKGDSSSKDVAQMEEEEVDEEDEQLPQQLEGKMITHENESLMVLVDNNSKFLYSAIERNEDGTMIQIGYIANDGSMHITKEASKVTARPSSSEHDQGTFTLRNSSFFLVL